MSVKEDVFRGERRVKMPLPRDRALAGTSLEVTSKFLKEFGRRRSVWYSVHLNIVAFIALSMIINAYCCCCFHKKVLIDLK